MTRTVSLPVSQRPQPLALTRPDTSRKTDFLSGHIPDKVIPSLISYSLPLMSDHTAAVDPCVTVAALATPNSPSHLGQPAGSFPG